MRATVSGLPGPLRLAMGLFTVGAFGFFGMMFRAERPVVGWTLLALCVFRAAVWVRELRDAVRRPDEGA
jgi:hypothetical protein